jgi:hypothetical protein
MAGLPVPTVRQSLTHAGLTLGGAGGGWLTAVATDVRTKAILVGAAVAGALIANGLAKIFETLYKRRPEIIEAKGAKKARIIEARGEAKALIIRTQAYTDVLRAGLDPDKTESAAEMLRLSSTNADLPIRRRLKDEPLAKLLAAPKARSSGTTRPDSGGGPQDGEPRDGSKSVVRQIRPARADAPELQADGNPVDLGDDNGTSTPSGQDGLAADGSRQHRDQVV